MTSAARRSTADDADRAARIIRDALGIERRRPGREGRIAERPLIGPGSR